MRRRRTHSVVLDPGVRALEAELPSPRLPRDRPLVGIVEFDPRRWEDTTIVGTTRSGAMCIDRAGVVDQHRTMPILVVADQDVPARQPRCREQHRGRNVRQRIGLVGPNMNELRGRATCGAAATRHIRGTLSTNCLLYLGHPCREVAGREITDVGLLDTWLSAA